MPENKEVLKERKRKKGRREEERKYKSQLKDFSVVKVGTVGQTK